MIRRTLLVLAASLAMLAVAVPAMAAEAVVRPGIEVQYAPSRDGRANVIVVATLPETATLPVTVRLPLVPGAAVTWSGEILGSVQQDIQREFETRQGTGGQYIEMRVEKSRVAQYEAELGAAATGTPEVQGTLNWVQSVETTSVLFSVETPPGAEDVRTDPPAMGQPQRAQDGSSLYSLAERQLTLGEKFDLSVSYRQGTPGGGAGGNTSSPLLPILLVVLGVAVVALLVLVATQRSRRA